MPRSPAVRAAAIVVVLLVLGVGWYLGSPLFIRTTTFEALPTAALSGSSGPSASAAATAGSDKPLPVARVIARGDLQYVDALHNGKGPVMLMQLGVQRFLRFDGVAITNAPDVHVYLSRDTGGKWSESTSLYLGALKATNGSFNYDVPADADLGTFKSVVVWCRAFAVLVTWADLKAA